MKDFGTYEVERERVPSPRKVVVAEASSPTPLPVWYEVRMQLPL